MKFSELFDRYSYIVSLISFFLTFILFFKDTLEFTKSLAAAAMFGSLVWVSYIMIRCLYLALRK